MINLAEDEFWILLKDNYIAFLQDYFYLAELSTLA